jgi:hypothetical protein
MTATLDELRDQLQAALDMLDEIMTVPPAPVIYSQRDPRWASMPLGLSLSTIGQEGCLITDAAQMLTELGRTISPGILNEWLKTHGGYVSGNHFVFASIDQFGLTKFRTLGECVNKLAPLDTLDRALSQGAYVIAKVDFSPGGIVQQHWVIYRGEEMLTDPWYGDRASFTRYGKNVTIAIIGYAIYDRV